MLMKAFYWDTCVSVSAEGIVWRESVTVVCVWSRLLLLGCYQHDWTWPTVHRELSFSNNSFISSVNLLDRLNVYVIFTASQHSSHHSIFIRPLLMEVIHAWHLSSSGPSADMEDNIDAKHMLTSSTSVDWFCKPPASQAQISASHVVCGHNRCHRRSVERCLGVGLCCQPWPSAWPCRPTTWLWSTSSTVDPSEPVPDRPRCLPCQPPSLGHGSVWPTVNADSGRRWRTSSTTVRGQSSPAGWRLFMRLSTMPSIGFRIRRRKHLRNKMKLTFHHQIRSTSYSCAALFPLN